MDQQSSIATRGQDTRESNAGRIGSSDPNNDRTGDPLFVPCLAARASTGDTATIHFVDNGEALFTPRPASILITALYNGTSVGGRLEGNHSVHQFMMDHDLSSPSELRSISAMDMEEVSCLLREQDADLLERHQSQTPNDATPLMVASSLSIAAIHLPPDFLLPPPSAGEAPVIHELRRRTSSLGNDGVPEYIPMGVLIPPPGGEMELRPTLGGQIYEQEPTVQDLERILSDHSATLAEAESLPPETLDRRLCEAAQFAEAVGDIKVAREIKILEEDRSDDDDDDDIENDALDQPTRIAATTKPEIPSSPSLQPEAIPNPQQQNFSVDIVNISFEVPMSTEEKQLSSASVGGGEESVHSASGKAAPEHPPSPFPNGSGDLRRKAFLEGHHKRRLSTKKGFLDQLPTGQTSSQSDYVYKGLRANPPEVCKRGIQRGNYAQLHRKAWLEVSDKYHRYGKNLRFYYRHWESLGCPTNMFFEWLDSKGEAAGQPLPEIEECPRSVLDSDTVLYITDPEVTDNYTLTLIPDENGRGRVLDIDGEPVITGPEGWIFVLRDNRMYGGQKITSVTGHRSKKRFHHSSFFGGKAVSAAGILLTDEEGFLTRLYPHSGHYRPRESHMQRVLFFLHHEGVDLRSFEMDMQQILHVARDKEAKTSSHNNDNADNKNPPKMEKKKKVESLFLIPAVLAACFLAHKARFIGAGIFEQIHQIRKGNVVSVTEALDLIDDGGYWQQ